jgi:hypothetical protein
MSMISDAADRRNARRFRAIQKGLIIFGGSRCDQPCAILDISATGARVRPLDSATVPDRFQLRDHKSSLRDCAVMWRHGATMGVKFV